MSVDTLHTSNRFASEPGSYIKNFNAENPSSSFHHSSHNCNQADNESDSESDDFSEEKQASDDSPRITSTGTTTTAFVPQLAVPQPISLGMPMGMGMPMGLGMMSPFDGLSNMYMGGYDTPLARTLPPSQLPQPIPQSSTELDSLWNGGGSDTKKLPNEMASRIDQSGWDSDEEPSSRSRSSSEGFETSNDSIHHSQDRRISTEKSPIRVVLPPSGDSRSRTNSWESESDDQRTRPKTNESATVERTRQKYSPPNSDSHDSSDSNSDSNSDLRNKRDKFRSLSSSDSDDESRISRL